MPLPVKVLFVCGQSNRRSLTAEKVFKDDLRVDVKSAGLSDSSKHRLSDSDIQWADLVLAMERKHAKRIRSLYSHIDPMPPVESLDIKDKFIYMQAELIDALNEGLDAALEEFHETNPAD